MFPSDEFWKVAMLMFSAVIGGIITMFLVLLLKLCERKGAPLEKTEAGHKSNKQPVEHDERYK